MGTGVFTAIDYYQEDIILPLNPPSMFNKGGSSYSLHSLSNKQLMGVTSNTSSVLNVCTPKKRSWSLRGAVVLLQQPDSEIQTVCVFVCERERERGKNNRVGNFVNQAFPDMISNY